MKKSWWAHSARLGLLTMCACTWLVQGCGPGPRYGSRPRHRKLAAMHYKQTVPNFSENNLGASGRAEGKITRTSERFNDLVCNYNPDVVFKDEENTNADRFMTKRCKDCLNRLAIAVLNQWPGVHLRVTEAWDEDGHHPADSLHYEGRAVDITTDDRRTEKYGLLAQLAVEAGFDWVHYESKYHIHCSVKADHAVTVEKGGCFPGGAWVSTPGGGKKTLASLVLGDRVMAMSDTGRVVYSPVILFLHREPRGRSTFLALQTEDGNRLVLTPHHLVFLASRYTLCHGEYKARFASRAQKGDYVLVHGAGDRVRPSRIISISVEDGVGIYSPLTQDGTVFVDGVLASTYAVVEDHKLAHWAFGPVRFLFSIYQLLWEESQGEGPVEVDKKSYAKKYPKDFDMNTSVNGRAGTYGENDTSKSNETLIMDIKEEVSNIHWYARLLYSFGQVFLDSRLFHP
ncbi:unnamed protein product [Gadus morhua 'NCC']